MTELSMRFVSVDMLREIVVPVNPEENLTSLI
jgi:hypothetical protein